MEPEGRAERSGARKPEGGAKRSPKGGRSGAEPEGRSGAKLELYTKFRCRSYVTSIFHSSGYFYVVVCMLCVFFFYFSRRGVGVKSFLYECIHFMYKNLVSLLRDFYTWFSTVFLCFVVCIMCVFFFSFFNFSRGGVGVVVFLHDYE